MHLNFDVLEFSDDRFGATWQHPANISKHNLAPQAVKERLANLALELNDLLERWLQHICSS